MQRQVLPSRRERERESAHKNTRRTDADVLHCHLICAFYVWHLCVCVCLNACLCLTVCTTHVRVSVGRSLMNFLTQDAAGSRRYLIHLCARKKKRVHNDALQFADGLMQWSTYMFGAHRGCCYTNAPSTVASLKMIMNEDSEYSCRIYSSERKCWTIGWSSVVLMEFSIQLSDTTQQNVLSHCISYKYSTLHDDWNPITAISDRSYQRYHS